MNFFFDSGLLGNGSNVRKSTCKDKVRHTNGHDVAKGDGDHGGATDHAAGDDDDDDGDSEAPRLTVRGPWAFFRGCGGVFLSSLRSLPPTCHGIR